MRCFFRARCTVLRLQRNFFSASAITPLRLPASSCFITNSAISYSRVTVLAKEADCWGASCRPVTPRSEISGYRA